MNWYPKKESIINNYTMNRIYVSNIIIYRLIDVILNWKTTCNNIKYYIL